MGLNDCFWKSLHFKVGKSSTTVSQLIVYMGMKDENLQNILLSKYRNGDTDTKIFRDLNDRVGLRTVKRWCQMIHQSGSITLATSPVGSCLVR